MSTNPRVRAAAAAIANARAGRRGAPAIVNVLEILPQKLLEEVLADAEVALEAAARQAYPDAPELQAQVDRDRANAARWIEDAGWRGVAARLRADSVSPQYVLVQEMRPGGDLREISRGLCAWLGPAFAMMAMNATAADAEALDMVLAIMRAEAERNIAAARGGVLGVNVLRIDPTRGVVRDAPAHDTDAS